jgi:hypothetical protein
MPSFSSVRLTGMGDCSTSRMISAFSDAGYLMPRPPIRDHAFFEQTVFQRQFRHNFLQGAGLTAQILHLVRGRRARRVAGEPLLPRLEEILRPAVIPAVIQVLDDSLAPAQFGDALLAAQALHARCGSSLRPRIAGGSPAGCLLRPFPLAPSPARISVSSSLLETLR